MSVTTAQLAKHLGMDKATVRRWPAQGCPVVRRGKCGPGRGALFHIPDVEAWRGKTNGPAGLTVQEEMQKIAEALWESLDTDHADIRADIPKGKAAAVLLVAFERCCKSFGQSFKFDQLPAPIRALVAKL